MTTDTEMNVWVRTLGNPAWASSAAKTEHPPEDQLDLPTPPPEGFYSGSYWTISIRATRDSLLGR